MSGYPGANRPPRHHGQQQGFPQPQPGYNTGGYNPGGYDQGGYGGGGGNFDPPGGGYNNGPGYMPGPPPPQQQFRNEGYNQGYQPQYNERPYPAAPQYGQSGGGGFPHPHPSEQQFHAPPGMPQQNFGPPSGPPPMHYGQQQQGQAPGQYQNMAVHYQPPNSNMYSNCTGRRKALAIGINYTGTSNALRGCHNDARNITKFLCERYQYKEEDIVMLLDLPNSGPMEQPTKANIIRAMQWLVRDASPNDSLFFHFSGHGGQAKDVDGDEEDGFDETIYPVDFKQAGQIIDDEMHAIMVARLPQGCRLTSIFDCCHSGSALDLPYIYNTSGEIKRPNMLADAGQGALGAVKNYMRGDIGGALGSVLGVGKRLATGGKVNEAVKQQKSSLADVISWSGCKDTQTSADTQEAGQATGAMSWAFMASLSKAPQQSYLQLLNTIRDELRFVRVSLL